MNLDQYDIEAIKIIRESVDIHIAKAASIHDTPDKILLDIAPDEHGGAKKYFKHAAVKTLSIRPGCDYEADLCCNNNPIIHSGTFDVIICTEVIEHVSNPFEAVKEMHRILKSGGMIYLTTPFNFRIHGPLPDNWRFTIHGLKELFGQWHIESIDQIESNRPLAPVHYRLTARKT